MGKLPQDLYDKAAIALNHSYSPYSKFKVACALRTDVGLFSGCNVENAAYGLVSCAEASAISGMVTAGQLRISEVLILVDQDILCPPCGGCRQRLYEMADKDTLVHLCTVAGKHKLLTVGELLPFAFGSKNLAA